MVRVHCLVSLLVCVCVCVCDCVNANANANANANRPRPNSKAADAEAEKHYLDSGHCKAVCLDKYLAKLESLNETVPPLSLMDSCRSNYRLADCDACLRGCEIDNSGLPLDCPIHCENNSECLRSCVLVHDLYYFHPGRCPAAQSIACNVTSNDLEECQNDGDCRDATAKCCQSNCGRVCARAQPVRPPRATITSTEFQENAETQDLINVEWKADNSRDAPVVFVLQLRQQFSASGVNDDSDRPWRTIVEDTKMAAQIENIPMCQKYQYRVAAVTPVSRSPFSQPGPYIGSDKRPNPPGKPMNVEVVKVILRGDVVDLELKWDPPTQSDLPIRSFEVSWVKRMRTPASAEPAYGSVQKQRTLKPNELSYTLTDLEKDEDFKITVIAVSFCVRSALESEPAIVLHSTSVTSLAQSEPESKREDTSCPAVSEQSQTQVSLIYDSDLQATITWSAPRLSIPISSYRVEWRMVACLNDPFQPGEQPSVTRNQSVTRNTYVALSQLHFTCDYEFTVRTFAIDNSCHLLVRKQFSTPSCSNVPLAPRAALPMCAFDVIASPPAPEKVLVKLRPIQDRDRYEALVSWTLPSGKVPALRYRVLLGKSISGSPNFLDRELFRREKFILSQNLPPLFDYTIDRNNALTKVVNNRSMSVGDLESNSVYVVYIQSLNDDGYSKATKVYFATITNDAAGSRENTQRKTRPPNTTPHIPRAASSQSSSSSCALFVSLCLCALFHYAR